MTALSKSALQTKIDTMITTNGVGAITGAQMNEILKDIADSYVNLISGITSIGIVEYDPARTYIAGVAALYNGTIVQALVETTGSYDAADWRVIYDGNKEVSVADIAARNAYNITSLPTNVFVVDDGDTRWALYRATTTGVGATFVKISDPDLLNAVMTAGAIKTAYESNADTNCFTDALLAKLNAISGTNTGDETNGTILAKIGYTPENNANKAVDFSVINDTKFPTVQATETRIIAAISALIDSSPGALDTLNELAAALGDDANFATTVTNALAGKLALAGGTMTGLLKQAKGANIASASTTDLNTATGNLVHITGTTTITALGTVTSGTKITVVFDDALILTHNATSLILPTAANITTATNDTAIFESEGGGNWRCISYQKSSGSPVFSANGILGIANTSGVYTFYANYTLAMSAATSGQCIEQFADITETGTVEITIKDGVNIDGHGHTYTLSNAGTYSNFKDSALCKISINNLIIKRTTGLGSCIQIDNGSVIDGSGSTCINTVASGEGVTITYGNIMNIIARSTGASSKGIVLFTGGDPESPQAQNCTAFGVSYGIYTYGEGGYVKNCYGEGGYGISNLKGKTINSYGLGSTIGVYSNYGFGCTGYSPSGSGYAGNGNLCSGFSITGLGFEGFGIQCIGKSTSGVGFFGGGYNCVGSSSSNYGFRLHEGYNLYSSVALSVTSNPIAVTNDGGAVSSQILDCSIICSWDNASGHGIYVSSAGTTQVAVGNNIRVVNASANGYYSTAAKTVKYANNSFNGAAAIVNANVTQGVSGTVDSQGNITY